MRHIARTSLGLLALGVIAPITVSAQTVDTSAPSGYQPAVAGIPSAPAPAPVSAPAPAPSAVHIHDGKKLCAACAAKQANAQMPPGKFVGCRHSSNGAEPPPKPLDERSLPALLRLPPERAATNRRWEIRPLSA
jgi:hypothetical protein